MKFEDLNINLNGMTLLEVVKAYPEAVVAAIEKSAEENKIMPENPFMDLSDLEDMLLKTITEGIEHFFKRNSTVSVLYRNFAENTRSTVEQLNHKKRKEYGPVSCIYYGVSQDRATDRTPISVRNVKTWIGY